MLYIFRGTGAYQIALTGTACMWGPRWHFTGTETFALAESCLAGGGIYAKINSKNKRGTPYSRCYIISRILLQYLSLKLGGEGIVRRMRWWHWIQLYTIQPY